VASATATAATAAAASAAAAAVEHNMSGDGGPSAGTHKFKNFIDRCQV